MDMIVVKDLQKKYGSVQAINDLSFSIKEGELFGFIGPDGAGKTTLFRILVTLLLPDAGKAFIDGRDVVKDYKALRNLLGYMPGRFSLYPDLSVEENLSFFATIFGTTIEENYNQIKDIYHQIEPFKKRRAGDLSGGMKQKLALSCALIHRPRVLLLDEPTTGVDAVSRKEFWEMLRRLKESGLTILVSTAYMDEAGKCDRIALIQKGRLLGIDTPTGIASMYNRQLLKVMSNNRYALIQALRKYPYAHTVYPFGDAIHYSDKRVTADLDALRRYLALEKLEDVAVEQIDAGIEDTFMALMQPEDTR